MCGLSDRSFTNYDCNFGNCMENVDWLNGSFASYFWYISKNKEKVNSGS